MKVYNLSYQHIAGHTMDKQTTEVYQLFLWLEEALHDSLGSNNTIHISTKEMAVQGLKQPPLPTPLSDDDQKREIEYQNFKKGR